MSEPRGASSSGRIWDGVKQAGHTIVGHRMRSLLLILGVSIGVATLLAIFTIVSGLSGKIREDVVSASRPYVSISRFSGLGGEDIEKLLRRRQLGPETIPAVREVPGVGLVDYIITNNDMSILQHEQERTQFVRLVGTAETFPYMYSFTIADGRYFTAEEVAARAAVCVLGDGPRKDLFPAVDPVGKWVRVDGQPYQVVGTIEARRQLFGSFGDNFATLPWSTFERDFLRERGREDRDLSASVLPGWDIDEVAADIGGAMRRVRRLAPGEPDDFEVTPSETYGDLVDRITGGVALVLVVLSSIGLLVGGIGVMNIMLISVTERTREIGIRMALGARRRDVLLQVLVEAGTLTGIGGIIGIGLGYVGSWGVTKVLHFPFAISPLVTVGAALFSIAIGLVFGLYPADRAARLDPIEALRRE